MVTKCVSVQSPRRPLGTCCTTLSSLMKQSASKVPGALQVHTTHLGALCHILLVLIREGVAARAQCYEAAVANDGKQNYVDNLSKEGSRKTLSLCKAADQCHHNLQTKHQGHTGQGKPHVKGRPCLGAKCSTLNKHAYLCCTPDMAPGCNANLRQHNTFCTDAFCTRDSCRQTLQVQASRADRLWEQSLQAQLTQGSLSSCNLHVTKHARVNKSGENHGLQGLDNNFRLRAL